METESQEGTTWESILVASQHKLKICKVILDYNKIQGSGYIKDILNIDPIGEVAKLFIGKLVELMDMIMKKFVKL